MSGLNPILLAIQKMYPYSQEDVNRAFNAVGKSYDLLILALDYSLVNNIDLIHSAQEVLEMRENRYK